MNKFEIIFYRIVYIVFVMSAGSFLFLEQHTRFEGLVVSTLLIMFAFLFEIWKKTVYDAKDTNND